MKRKNLVKKLGGNRGKYCISMEPSYPTITAGGSSGVSAYASICNGSESPSSEEDNNNHKSTI